MGYQVSRQRISEGETHGTSAVKEFRMEEKNTLACWEGKKNPYKGALIRAISINS